MGSVRQNYSWFGQALLLRGSFSWWSVCWRVTFFFLADFFELIWFHWEHVLLLFVGLSSEQNSMFLLNQCRWQEFVVSGLLILRILRQVHGVVDILRLILESFEMLVYLLKNVLPYIELSTWVPCTLNRTILLTWLSLKLCYNIFFLLWLFMWHGILILQLGLVVKTHLMVVLLMLCLIMVVIGFLFLQDYGSIWLQIGYDWVCSWVNDTLGCRWISAWVHGWGGELLCLIFDDWRGITASARWIAQRRIGWDKLVLRYMHLNMWIAFWLSSVLGAIDLDNCTHFKLGWRLITLLLASRSWTLPLSGHLLELLLPKWVRNIWLSL